MKNYFYSLLLLASLASAMDSIDGQKWDGQHYDKYARPQLEAAKKHLENISFAGCYSITDIGCGSGAITAIIADKLPNARVVGSDVNGDMIRAARKNYGSRENLSFFEQDAQKPIFNNEFDKAVSFLTLHWVQDKQAFFTSLFKALKPGGQFYMTVGTKKPEIEELKKKFFGALIARDSKWKFLLGTTMVTGSNTVSKPELETMAAAAGFEDIEVTEQVEIHSFPTTHELAQFVGTFISGYKDIADLPASQRQEFITTAAELWTKECADGKPSYTWANLVAKGKKPKLELHTHSFDESEVATQP